MAAYVPEFGSDCTARMFQLVQESKPIRTLVVDDSPEILQVVCLLLEMEERVEVIGRATDGSEALDAVVSLRPDLVVMDVQMPRMDGPTAAALIV